MTSDQDAVVFQLLKQGMSTSETAKETGLSRPTVRKIAREEFPELYWSKQNGFEVEVDDEKDAQETIDYYKEMGRQYLGKRKENTKRKESGWIITFSGKKKQGS